MEKAIFLDRDGTINEDVGDFCSKDKLIFIPGAIDALKILQTRFLLFIVTNQSGIGKSIFTEEKFLQFNKYFNAFLRKEEVRITKIYYCPHTKEENCVCRKPSPYFLKQAEEDYNIDLKNSYVIGDHPHDIEMAHAVRAHSVYLLTGHGKKHLPKLTVRPDFVANNLYETAVWVIGNLPSERKEVCKNG